MTRAFFALFVFIAAIASGALFAETPQNQPARAYRFAPMEPARFDDWRARWEKAIVRIAQTRYCDTETGEELGWLVSPVLRGFYYGYLATHDTQWIDRLIDWANAVVARAVEEPDGYLGWPKVGAAGTRVDGLDDYNADSLLGEAMVLRPMVLMAGEIMRTPALREKYGQAAEDYIRLSETMFEKWDARGAWRATADGTISVELPFGLDAGAKQWTAGYASRFSPDVGFSHPNNKANLIAIWLLAMADVTQKPVYRQRANAWFRIMKSRMKPTRQGTFQIWSYWQPAGPWDYRLWIVPKQWIAVHANAGYYEIDVEAIVGAYEHGVVFGTEDLDRLIATAAETQRFWNALVPYDPRTQTLFEQINNPERWTGLVATPWYLALQSRVFGLAAPVP